MLEDLTFESHPSHEGNKSLNSDIYLRKKGSTEEILFMSRIAPFDPKVPSKSISAISKQRKTF